MEIIEQQIVGKDPKKGCEDGIVVTPDFVAVIDGSTSKSEYRHSLWRSNGRQMTTAYVQASTTDTSGYMNGKFWGLNKTWYF